VDNSLIALIVLSLFLGCGCWLIFLWAVKKGEFDDIERPKHRMLDDHDDDDADSK
jgi:cbb3-type cytochrome oxidase maturation protein